MRRPWWLALWTWLFLAWSLTPIAVAVRIAFSRGSLASHPSGFSMEWFGAALAAPRIQGAFLRSVALATAAASAALVLGAAGALGLRRWRTRTAGAARATTLLALGTPQLVLGTALFLTVVELAPAIPLGFPAQLLGHIGLAAPFVFVIVTARLLTISPDCEEAAMDLGAPPGSALRLVLVPLLRPALAAGAAIAFVLSYDNLVISDQLCYRAACETIPMLIYNGRTGTADPSPTVYAVMTISLAITVTVAMTGLALWRRGVRTRTTAYEARSMK